MVLPRLHCMNEPQFTQQFSKFMNIYFSNFPPLICPYTEYCTKHRFTHTEFCILVFSMPYFIVTLCHLLTQKYQLSFFLKIQLQSILEILRMRYRTSKEVTKKNVQVLRSLGSHLQMVPNITIYCQSKYRQH